MRAQECEARLEAQLEAQLEPLANECAQAKEEAERVRAMWREVGALSRTVGAPQHS